MRYPKLRCNFIPEDLNIYIFVSTLISSPEVC